MLYRAAGIAQWNCVRLPSFGPGVESQEHYHLFPSAPVHKSAITKRQFQKDFECSKILFNDVQFFSFVEIVAGDRKARPNDDLD